jgi:class 3 adenylate cyclase
MVLTEVCQACGAGLPADARFCHRCGTAVAQDLTSGSPSLTQAGTDRHRGSDRERKVATLLFADLVDFTQLFERLDAELVSSLIGSTFERLAEEVARFEGTLEKYAGDSILAVFGVPSAHEDDPERAVRAALEMQAVMAGTNTEAEQPRLALRIGVESGEVLVDQARAVAARDLFLTGDAVNTAVRLQQAAAPGTIVVGPNAHAATRHIFEYQELGPLALKGKSSRFGRVGAGLGRRWAWRRRSSVEAPRSGC